MKSILSVRVLAVGAAGLVIAAGALGQEQPAAAKEGEQSGPAKVDLQDAARRTVQFGLDTGASYSFRSDLDDGNGDVSIVRAGGQLDVVFPIGQKSRLAVTPGLLYSGYNFEGATGIAPGFSEPWSDVWEYKLGATAFLVQDSHWSYIFGATIDSQGEQGATFEDTLTYSGIGGARYAFSDSFALTGGLIVSSRLEKNVAFLPLLGIEWKIDDHWTLSNTRSRIQSDVGNGLALEYRFNENYALRLSGSYTSYNFRLDDTGFNPGGVVEDQRVPVALTFEWTLSKHFTLELSGGAAVWQEYEVRNSNGDKLSSIETDAQPFLSAILAISF